MRYLVLTPGFLRRRAPATSIESATSTEHTVSTKPATSTEPVTSTEPQVVFLKIGSLEHLLLGRPRRKLSGPTVDLEDFSRKVGRAPVFSHIYVRAVSAWLDQRKWDPKKTPPLLRCVWDSSFWNNPDQSQYEALWDEHVTKSKKNSELRLRWQSYFDFATKINTRDAWLARLEPSAVKQEIVCLRPSARDSDAEAWLRSRVCTALATTVSRQAKTSRRIVRIVCFGFGEFYSTNGTHAHLLAAFVIANVLERAYACSPIQIVVQDTLKYGTYFRLLSQHHEHANVHAVEDPQRYLLVDENTLVMSVYSETHVLEIVADLCWPKVPAGIFANDGYGWAPGQTEWSATCRITPRVLSMLQQLDGYTFEEFEDEPTAWMKQMQLLLAPKESADQTTFTNV